MTTVSRQGKKKCKYCKNILGGNESPHYCVNSKCRAYKAINIFNF